MNRLTLCTFDLGSGIQRGSTYPLIGDPLSPGWASIPNAYRLDPKDVTNFPKIPGQPIGYDDAKFFLDIMEGPEVPIEWKGAINTTYNLGGSLKNGYKVKLSTHNYFGSKKSSNVIGYVKGEVEPDRYVLMSNHRDAWGYGSVDPSSGTSQLMEIARTLGEMLKKGWKPRRTIVLVSWASEEYTLGGNSSFRIHTFTNIIIRCN